jgi:hypothetical protein
MPFCSDQVKNEIITAGGHKARTGCKDEIKRKSRHRKALNMVDLNLQPLTAQVSHLASFL